MKLDIPKVMREVFANRSLSDGTLTVDIGKFKTRLKIFVFTKY